MARARKRDLIGRKIVAVDWRPFQSDPRRPRERAHDPIITLDNGRRVYFLTEETEVGEYGTVVGITDRESKAHA